MNPHDIKASLAKKGFTQVGLARQTGVTPTAIAHAIFGRTRSRRIEGVISEATGIQPERLWPQWYRTGTTRSGV